MIKKIAFLAIMVQSLLGFTYPDMLAQDSPFDPEMSDQASQIEEKVDGFTDRSLYIAGEAITFSMRVHTYGLQDAQDWTRVLYVELLSVSGNRKAQGKFRVQDKMAIGELRIPEGLLTGDYFLRAYTRWMRNRDPSAFLYLPLRIINPFSSELDEAIAIEHGDHSLRPLAVREGVVDISTGSISHGRGDTIRVDLIPMTGDISKSVNGCLSIMPAAAKPGLPLQIEGRDVDEGSFQLDYLPDMFGVNLSGRVLGSEENQTLEGRRVHFTILGEQPAYSIAHTDAYGRFSISLPRREGKLELFIQPEQTGTGALEVRIDQDFDSRILSLETPPFSLDQREKEALTQMARKYQLAGIFQDKPEKKKSEETPFKVPIYGNPNFRLNLDEYVLLPTLEEVFINLVPDVTPFVRRNSTYLSIASVNPAISMFPPLLMIDQVPIFSMEQFLSISPAKISHIDVVNDVFIRGDMRFGGIINLWSLEGNMAGIDLPEYSFFIDYHALIPDSDLPHEAYSSSGRLPDTRNTLLWMPALQLEGSLPRSFLFAAPDYPGEYAIIFRGWDDAGRIVTAESVFIVE